MYLKRIIVIIVSIEISNAVITIELAQLTKMILHLQLFTVDTTATQPKCVVCVYALDYYLSVINLSIIRSNMINCFGYFINILRNYKMETHGILTVEIAQRGKWKPIRSNQSIIQNAID